MKTGWTELDIRIGWLTYSKDIAPRCTAVQGDGVAKDRYVQVLVSSITEGSADVLDWNKPLHEQEFHEQRLKKFSSSSSLRGLVKGPTFDNILRDIGKE
ncbi:hypothetical protein HD806DRAFT_491402 [Xylariaceae sp. AK1471]|nr:hypothetical protein HD806DRAFT_491402 [Xylariaceae sp. AK1471]